MAVVTTFPVGPPCSKCSRTSEICTGQFSSNQALSCACPPHAVRSIVAVMPTITGACFIRSFRLWGWWGVFGLASAVGVIDKRVWVLIVERTNVMPFAAFDHAGFNCSGSIDEHGIFGCDPGSTYV